jgi:putative DNA primase/helicase
MLTINLEGDFLDVDAVLLTEADRIAAARNMKAAAATLEPHAKTVKGAIKRAKIAELTGRGVAADTAAHAAHLRYDRMMLAGSDTVIFEDGIVVTVGDLLGPKGADFDGKLCLDPVEPDYDGGRAVGKFFWNSGRGPVVHSFAHGSTTYRLAHDDQSIFAAIEAGGADHARLVAALANAEVNSIVAAQAETAVAKALGLGTKRQQLQEEVAKVRSKIARHSGETEPVPLIDVAFDQRLPPSGFPFVRHEPKRVVILDHREDVRHLTRAYGVMPAYNLISKEIGCVGVDEGSGDNKGSALFSLMRSLCALNEVPTENFDAHFLALADENARNPVTDYLKPLPWDGAPRFDKLAAVMGPRDPEVARIAVRIALLQAVAAADHASIARGLDTETRAHFESIIVFQGGQGLGKTKGLRRWLPRALRQYMKEGQVLDLRNKDSHKLAVSCWICELGELEATFKKSDIAALKAFVSKDMDEIRLPYARAASTFLRRTAFFASVNEEHFLSDPTGNRRFVPLAVTQVDPGWSDDEIDQLWAEAWHRYTAGERWWPTKDEEPVLAANAERYRAVLPIEEKLDQRYDWGKPASGTRRTAIQVCSDLDDPVPGPSTVKAIQAALRRLWLASGLAEFRDGDLWTTDQNGSARRVNSSGGKKPGWLLPPRRPAETMAQAGQTIPPRLSLVGSGSDVAVPAVKTYPLPPAPSPRG